MDPIRKAQEAMADRFKRMVDDFFSIQVRYQSAIREVETKLAILDDEYNTRHRRNPIHHMQSRMKSIQSIMEKLERKRYDVNIDSAVKNLMDIAGIRVICSYVQDVYTVANLLTKQDDIRLIEVRDYIQHPKANGYRSLHLIIEVPVYLSSGKVDVPVEVQIRTIAMDFWASLEHDLRYKAPEVPQDISDELQRIANDIAALDDRMQRLHDQVDALPRPDNL